MDMMATVPGGILTSIPVELIDLGDRLREVKSHRVEVLAKDIDLQGLLEPLVVVADGDRYRIVSGAHRLAAVCKLKFGIVEAHVLPEGMNAATLRYAEIMANVNREELTKLERAEYLAALKETWADLNPSARHGGDRRSAAVRAVKEAEAADQNKSPILGLLKEVAEKTGLGRASFFNAIHIVRGLTGETKARIRDTWLEDHQAGLQQLAGETPEMQAAICDQLFATPPKATTVADAKLLAEGRRLPSRDDRHYQSAVSTWGRMTRANRAAFVELHGREILEIAREKGWTL